MGRRRDYCKRIFVAGGKRRVRGATNIEMNSKPPSSLFAIRTARTARTTSTTSTVHGAHAAVDALHSTWTARCVQQRGVFCVVGGAVRLCGKKTLGRQR